MTYEHKIRKDTNRWHPLQPVFISAQTGQGKNYFIEYALIPYVWELNYKNKTKQRVLILSNRLALKRQMKNRLDGNDALDDQGESRYSYSDVVDIMTYHGLLNQNNQEYFKNAQKHKDSRYIFVICDEAHFFTSDAMFNPHTQKILSAIVKLFKKAIRVYMSATPYECLEYINTYERMNKPDEKYQLMLFYHFKRDYSYLDVKAYSDITELYGRIVESVNKRKEKWLIFIDDKQMCKTVKQDLENYGNKNSTPLVIGDKDSKIEKVFAIDANSKTNPKYQSMILAETFKEGTCVLITTSVLDNGINLKGIDNIVVSDMSKSKVLQMVGRARVNGSDDHKTLYIKRFDEKYVSKRIETFQSQKEAYHSYELAYDYSDNPFDPRGYSEYLFLNKYYNNSIKDWENAKHWFGRPIKEPTKLYVNEIAKSMLDRLVPQYQFIYNEMQKEYENGRVGQKYLEYQLSWFGKTYCEDDDITYADKDKAKKALIAFLESYAENGEQITDNEKMKAFQEEFVKLYETAFLKIDKNRNRESGPRKMNRALQEQSLEYKIDGQAQLGPWTVVRWEWKSGDSKSE